MPGFRLVIYTYNLLKSEISLKSRRYEHERLSAILLQCQYLYFLNTNQLSYDITANLKLESFEFDEYQHSYSLEKLTIRMS